MGASRNSAGRASIGASRSTTFEHDVDQRIRHGGDVAGLVDTLDYLHGMGIKVCLMCDPLTDRKHMLTMSRVSILQEPLC